MVQKVNQETLHNQGAWPVEEKFGSAVQLGPR
jgi:hypothetical protein